MKLISSSFRTITHPLVKVERLNPSESKRGIQELSHCRQQSSVSPSLFYPKEQDGDRGPKLSLWWPGWKTPKECGFEVSSYRSVRVGSQVEDDAVDGRVHRAPRPW